MGKSKKANAVGNVTVTSSKPSIGEERECDVCLEEMKKHLHPHRNKLCVHCGNVGNSCRCGGDDILLVPGSMIVTARILYAKGYDVIGCSDGMVEGEGAIFMSFSETYGFKTLPGCFEYAYETETGTSMVVSNAHLRMREPIDRQAALIESLRHLLFWASELPSRDRLSDMSSITEQRAAEFEEEREIFTEAFESAYGEAFAEKYAEMIADTDYLPGEAREETAEYAREVAGEIAQDAVNDFWQS